MFGFDNVLGALVPAQAGDVGQAVLSTVHSALLNGGEHLTAAQRSGGSTQPGPSVQINGDGGNTQLETGDVGRGLDALIAAHHTDALQTGTHDDHAAVITHLLQNTLANFAFPHGSPVIRAGIQIGGCFDVGKRCQRCQIADGLVDNVADAEAQTFQAVGGVAQRRAGIQLNGDRTVGFFMNGIRKELSRLIDRIGLANAQVHLHGIGFAGGGGAVAVRGVVGVSAAGAAAASQQRQGHHRAEECRKNSLFHGVDLPFVCFLQSYIIIKFFGLSSVLLGEEDGNSLFWIDFPRHFHAAQLANDQFHRYQNMVSLF